MRALSSMRFASRLTSSLRESQTRCSQIQPKLLGGANARAFRVSVERGYFARRFRGLSSPRSKYMMHIPFLVHDLIYFTANLCELSPRNRSLRSIMTCGYVDEKEVIKALENFLSTTEDKTLSTKEKCSMYIQRLIRSEAIRHVSDLSLLLKFIRELTEIIIHREPIVMNRIIHVTAKSGQLDKSLVIFEELKNSKAKMDTVTFNTVLVMLGRAGRVDQMLYEFNVMKDFGHTPNIVTYNTLINCLRRLGRLDMCKSFAKEMVGRGIELDLRTYTALVDGLGRAGHVIDAMRLFDEMKRSHRPSIYVYRAMISNLKKAGRFEFALNLLEEMNSNTLKLVGPEDFKQKNKMKYYLKERFGGS
nr:pentatricopeptide repeat protein AaPPR1480 [Agave angustifolia]